MIEERLRAALTPETLAVTDESHQHVGHAGAKSGKGHFAVTIVSPRFAGVSTVERHRMIYAALGEVMEREIHALRISARAPGESAP
jgi:BolA protein